MYETPINNNKPMQGDHQETIAYRLLLNKGFNTHGFHLYIKNAGVNRHGKDKGRGVFALAPIEKDHVIEFCPAVKMTLTREEESLQANSLWHSNLFWYTETKEGDPSGMQQGMFALGYGTLINSADSPEDANCFYEIYPEDNLVVFKAIKGIKEHDEILSWFGEGFYKKHCI